MRFMRTRTLERTRRRSSAPRRRSLSREPKRKLKVEFDFTGFCENAYRLPNKEEEDGEQQTCHNDDDKDSFSNAEPPGGGVFRWSRSAGRRLVLGVKAQDVSNLGGGLPHEDVNPEDKQDVPDNRQTDSNIRQTEVQTEDCGNRDQEPQLE